MGGISTVCPSCQTQREIILHCLVECSFGRACWERTEVGVDTSVLGSFTDWLNDKLRSFEGDSRNTVAMACWAL